MGKPKANLHDQTAQEYLVAATEFARNRAPRSPLALLQRIVGSVAVSNLSITEHRAGTGSFYRRWDSVEEFNEAVARHILEQAFDGVVLEGLLQDQFGCFLSDTSPEIPVATMLDCFTGQCATEVTKDAFSAMIRVQMHPHLDELGINRDHTVSRAATILGAIHRHAGEVLPPAEELQIQAVAFLYATDLKATQLQFEVE